MRANENGTAFPLPDCDPSIALAQALQHERQQALATSHNHLSFDRMGERVSITRRIWSLIFPAHSG
jgi:hypothetical protein